jgi:hypothetical protein
MQIRERRLALLIALTAIAWHLCGVFAPPRIAGNVKNTEARDFASYHYAAVATKRGQSPYENTTLDRIAKREGYRTSVHPYLYPPPFLLGVYWSVPVQLPAAFAIHKAMQTLACWIGLWGLVRWWRPMGGPVRETALIALAGSYGMIYGLQMGQANASVFALTMLGLWAGERDRPKLGGALLGVACMWKMAPALFVFWWAWKGRWRAAISAVLAAVVLSILTLPIMDLGTQWSFYRDVLPSMASGEYNGLTIRIDMFGNHSLSNLWHQLFPSGENVLSGLARTAASATLVTLLALLAMSIERTQQNATRTAAQVGLIALTMILVPVYTYEHHLIWAIPATVVTLTALARGTLSARWVAPLAFAFVALSFPLPHLKELATQALTDVPVVAWLVQESKTFALLILWACCARLSRRG